MNYSDDYFYVKISLKTTLNSPSLISQQFFTRVM